MLDETREKLLSKFRMPAETVERAIEVLSAQMESVDPKPLERRIARDPDDDVVIASALAGECAVIVSGDRGRTAE